MDIIFFKQYFFKLKGVFYGLKFGNIIILFYLCPKNLLT